MHTRSNTQPKRGSLGAFVALGLLVVSGCAYLAPGVAPIGGDPPADLPYALNDSGDDSDIEAGEIVPVAATEGTYVARQYPQTYTPYPRTYPAPPPPNVYTPPNTTGQLPATNYAAPQPPSVYQLPPGYQTPNSSSGALQRPAPLTGFPQQPRIETVPAPSNPFPQQSLPAPSGPYTPPVQNQPMQSAPVPLSTLPAPLGDYGLSDPSAYAAPSYGAPALVDPLGNPIVDPYGGTPTYIPDTRMADLEITGTPGRTGRLMVGAAVNSDAGVTGQITLDERNFDITRFPTSFQDLASGTAFRGAGQTLRLEAVPGSQFKRYTASFANPNLFGYLPISLGLSGFLYTRSYQDYQEERLGGRVSFGYRITPDLSVSTGIGGQAVEIKNPRVTGVSALDRVVGNNNLYTGELRLTHDTRNSPFQASEGHFFEVGFEQAFGDFDYSRIDLENRNYLLVSERADGSGKQTITLASRLGFSGQDTPLFENYFAGGYSTLRGFNFRGASPVDSGVQVGGRFQWLNTLEYMFPITADDSFKGVAFVDFGTVERDIEIDKDNFRVAPGLGLRVAIPMLGPAPLAFDFAYPVTRADTDQKRIFSFYVSALR